MGPNNTPVAVGRITWINFLREISLPHFKTTNNDWSALAAQMTNVTVERCTKYGISAHKGGSVALTGCTVRDNKVDYRRDSKSSIVVDGSARPEGDS